MKLTDIKKTFYKQNTQARFVEIKNNKAKYFADLDDMRVYFEIPVSDMGEASFGAVMEAKLLIRWIIKTSGIEE